MRGSWSRLGPLVAVSVSLAAALPAMHPAGAWASTPSYSLTVTESASTMTYGDPSPSFRAYLTPPADESFRPDAFYLTVDSGNYAGSVSGISPPYVLYVGGVSGLAVGQHAVAARYFSQKYGWLSSATIPLTVLKKTPPMTCGMSTVENTYVPNAPITINVSLGYSPPVDLQGGTFSVTFTGPRTFTTANLIPNSAGQIFTSMPPAYGVYKSTCGFSGNATFNAAETSLYPSMIVSARNPVAAIKLYTNPTPVTHGPMITWDVVVSAKSGLPTPTGNVSLTIAGAYTRVFALGPDGSVTFQAIAPVFPPGTSIRVWYFGDPVYQDSYVDLPMSTRLIPGAGPQSTGTPQGRPMSSSAPTPTPPDATGTETPTAPPVSMALPSPSSSNRVAVALTGGAGQSRPGGSASLYLAAALVSVTLASAGSVLGWRLRRRRRATANGARR